MSPVHHEGGRKDDRAIQRVSNRQRMADSRVVEPLCGSAAVCKEKGAGTSFPAGFLQALKRDRISGSPEIRSHDTKHRKSSTDVLFSDVAVSYRIIGTASEGLRSL